MYTKFQKHILEEIKEAGDYNFILVIPYFLEIERNEGMVDTDKKYDISSPEFDKKKTAIK